MRKTVRTETVHMHTPHESELLVNTCTCAHLARASYLSAVEDARRRRGYLHLDDEHVLVIASDLGYSMRGSVHLAKLRRVAVYNWKTKARAKLEIPAVRHLRSNYPIADPSERAGRKRHRNDPDAVVGFWQVCLPPPPVPSRNVAASSSRLECWILTPCLAAIPFLSASSGHVACLCFNLHAPSVASFFIH